MSASQPARWVLSWIRALPDDLICLDYGCGRLRYTKHLASQTASATAVDSRAQLSRVMTIYGERCTILEFVARHGTRINILPAEDFDLKSQFDFAICINVLSSIPSIRWRRQVLRSIHSALVPGGGALFANQHRNSYFRGYPGRLGAKRHLDGWLIPHDHGLWFYGLIPADPLCEMLTGIGFSTIYSGCRGQSAFAFCSKGEPNTWLHRMPDPRRIRQDES